MCSPTLRLALLYIPIWLCSNNVNGVVGTMVDYFTFQSGYVQMKKTGYEIEYLLNFTFQSGYVQIQGT